MNDPYVKLAYFNISGCGKFPVTLQHGMNIEKIKHLLFPYAEKLMGGSTARETRSIEDVYITIGSKELKNSEIFDEYTPEARESMKVEFAPGDRTSVFSHIRNESLRDRVLESFEYITSLDNRILKGLCDQEINISDVKKHIQTFEEARNSVPEGYKWRFQSHFDCAQRVLNSAPMVNRLIHLSGNQYDDIQSKLTGAALKELEPYNKSNPTFIHRLTNELRRIYEVESGETIQDYSMRVESALHMMSKALEILQESPETDREVEQFFLDSIDRVWDSYLTFLD